MRHRTRNQQGVVLIVSLIILLAMTLVGVTAMRVTSLEERMAGNIQDKYLSFQRAETALRDGEDALIADIESASRSLTYLHPNNCDPNCWNASGVTWSSDGYIVEDLGRAPINKDCLDLTDTSCYIKVYRVSSQGAGQLGGPSGGTQSMLQTVAKFTE